MCIIHVRCFTDVNFAVFLAGKKRRVTFVEVNNDINCMIDVAKVADIVLMLVDITVGIEMEVFEFLEICRAHGTPKIMGVSYLPWQLLRHDLYFGISDTEQALYSY